MSSEDVSCHGEGMGFIHTEDTIDGMENFLVYRITPVDRVEKEEGQVEGGQVQSSGGASGSRIGPGPDSGSSAPSSVPQSLVTSRDDEDDEDEENSDKRSNSHGELRTKSSQRWMKLRTTVQVSSAMPRKPVLKREDSFLKRFSSRPIPESQETLDIAEGDGDETNDKDMGSRRGRRPRRLQKPPKTVVNPDENFYYYWLMLVSFCVLYNLWTLIVRQSLPELQALAPNIWFALDCFTDIIFVMDILVQFRTGYLEQGLIVCSTKKLAAHYFKSKFFFLDLFALFPLDLMQMILGTNPILRVMRFIKIYRVHTFYYMVEARTIYPNVWRVSNLVHILLMLAHWFGNFYFLLSEAEDFKGEWAYPYRPGEYATLTRKYLGSVYWSTLTLTTIGDLPTPETNAE
ncbi:PREDICTED: cyclic nucleotide-gated cation channel alpha-3-like [Trachymyrmex cornetzi]|uniref:cyclic nucleotide-gated cation channel alpha-3-like n=1 Tax=Trachymyrmex cornetzi TaxID=471704 RepID=UPI00084F8374|nr:PREDICTED: cyclic nucleotide-gated cation channel alpha-3-like [Trachymyrmex cornetzi]